MSNLETVMGAINNLKAVWELDSQMAKDLRKSSRRGGPWIQTRDCRLN